MRKTAKLDAAVKALIKLNLYHGRTFASADALYATLSQNGYGWDAATGEWVKTAREVDAKGRIRLSMFTDEDNMPSGVYRLRVMGHPDEIEAIVRSLKEKLIVTDVSEYAYPNRKGQGVWVYLTCRVLGGHRRGRKR